MLTNCIFSSIQVLLTFFANIRTRYRVPWGPGRTPIARVLGTAGGTSRKRPVQNSVHGDTRPSIYRLGSSDHASAKTRDAGGRLRWPPRFS